MSRILIVEDHNDNADLAATAIRGAGHQADVASTVDEALGMLASSGYALVILDLTLDRDATSLHNALAARGLPVVVASGADEFRVRAVTDPHGWDYLLKPFNPDELVEMVARRLMKGSGTRTSNPRSLTPSGLLRIPTPAPLSSPPSGGSRSTSSPPPRRETPSLPLPMSHDESVSNLVHTDARVAVHETWSGRIVRLTAALSITALVLVGDRTGHPVPWYVIVALTALGLGARGATEALKKRPGAVVGGASALVLVAVAGELLNAPALQMGSALVAGTLPMLDRALDSMTE